MENQANKKVLDKIRKLLALAEDKGASEGEVENALRMAQHLMMKHQIEQGDVFMSKADIAKEIFSVYSPAYENVNWIWDLLKTVGKNQNVKIYGSKKINPKTYKLEQCWTMVGFEEDRLVVKETCLRMVPVIQNLARRRAKEAQKDFLVSKSGLTTFHNSYLKGFVLGLDKKLEEERAHTLQLSDDSEKYALIVVKKNDLIQGFIEENMNITMSKSRATKSNDIALMQGFQDGKQKNLSNQIGNG